MSAKKPYLCTHNIKGLHKNKDVVCYAVLCVVCCNVVVLILHVGYFHHHIHIHSVFQSKYLYYKRILKLPGNYVTRRLVS